jgi:hypothetical protein
MFDADTVRLLMKAAVELDRHGMCATDTAMQLDEAMCCDDCTAELLDYAITQAL